MGRWGKNACRDVNEGDIDKKDTLAGMLSPKHAKSSIGDLDGHT